jgi:peptide/nickel transport system ATP-binding protein
MPLLRIDNLQVDFIVQGQIVPALKGISLEVNRGETVAVVGESGSGKSVTALSILQLLDVPPARYTQGAILLERDDPRAQPGASPRSPDARSDQRPPPVITDLLRVSPAELRRIRGRKVSMIFQEPMTSLNPVFSCGEQIAETLRLHQGLSRKEARQEAIACLDRVFLPDPRHLYDRFPHQLSGGQKQRVMIAMAVCCRPSLLIADEPTTALDVTTQKGIIHLLKTLQDQSGMGILFITHDLGLVSDIGDRAVILYRGRILEQGPVTQLFNTPTHPYTKALLACRPAGHPRGQRLPVVEDFWIGETGEVPQIAPVEHTPTPKRPTETVLFRVDNLKVWYPAREKLLAPAALPTKAVDDVSFTINEGEILGLVGGSGSGKTTLGRALLRLIPVTSGTIRFGKEDLLTLPAATMKAYRRQLQIVFQDPYSSLNPKMTIGQALTEVLQTRDRLSYRNPEHPTDRFGDQAADRNRNHPSDRSRARSAVLRRRASDLLQKVQLGPTFLDRYPHECSGGQRQRAVIARALAMDPRFILFDECVSALDVSVQAQVLNLIGDLKRELGFTAVFISHDLSVVRYLCDRIIVMQQGKIA